MHQLIRIITKADSPENAATTASDLFTGTRPQLVPPFDYGTRMDEGNRWSHTFPSDIRETGAIEADSETGLHLIENGWSSQTKELKRNFDAIKQAFDDGLDFEAFRADTRVEDVDVEAWNPIGLATTEDELTDSFSTNVRYAMYCLGRYTGPDIYLYRGDGGAVRGPDQYGRLVADIKNGVGLDDDDMDYYVVPMDVHY